MNHSAVLKSKPHRRFNPLTNEWVLVSPHRTNRPWQGHVEDSNILHRPKHDKSCYLCPGNVRANGEINPNYTHTFVFDNDFASLLADTDQPGLNSQHPLFQSRFEYGICRVICFSPRHDLTLAQMDVLSIQKIIDLWADQSHELGNLDSINHIQIFENKGAMMGCSNPHPHGQIWAQNSIPNQSLKELETQYAYFESNKTTLLSDYAEEELTRNERVIFANDGFLVVVPFWVSWPFETLLISRQPVAHINQLSTTQREQMAEAICDITIRYDNLFSCEFPYSAGLHQAPFDGQDYPFWQLHMHFYPPLLRSANVKKFMVGYEMFAEPQRDITPEVSAERLKSMSTVHYLNI